MFDLEVNSFMDSMPDIIKHHMLLNRCVKERSDYHPEGNAYEHIVMVVDKCLKSNNPNLVAIGVLHDLMKHNCKKQRIDGSYSTPGHDKEGAEEIRNDFRLQEWIESIGADVETVIFCVENHIRIKNIFEMKKKKQNLLLNSPFYDLLFTFSLLDNTRHVFD